ncbi:hypothetical protein CJ030_MR2G020038 [Morella rubra]|uniref:GRF-type domain-containing protein n=1 Tax=Morella rubra TaxID=262757 RepID=A0A6A1WGK0_9ROSI|nr:hypothetical protein CJ030_MR2G020038 [Morella rubra]
MAGNLTQGLLHQTAAVIRSMCTGLAFPCELILTEDDDEAVEEEDVDEYEEGDFSRSLIIPMCLIMKWVAVGHMCVGLEAEDEMSGPTRCNCELTAPLKTSWTDANPGRRFFGCAKYDGKVCGFYEWFDLHTCPRGMEVGPHLVKKNKALQAELDLQKNTVKVLKVMLGASWVALAFMGVLLFSAHK